MTGSACSRRALLLQTTAALATAAAAVPAGALAAKTESSDRVSGDGEILGQGNFRYRAHRMWGRLDPRKYPAKDCHGISEDRDGRIVLDCGRSQ